MTSASILGSIKAGGTVVRHSEYIGDIVSPGQGGFIANPPFVLNPQCDETFLWGSTIASCFEQYKFRRLIFEYRTLSTEIASSGNPAMGSVIMGTKYNALFPNFTNKQEMENYEYTSSCKPSQTMFHTINTKAITRGKLFCRNGSAAATPQNADRRLFDIGNFTIATANVQAQAGAVLGELWVHYEVVLYKPILVRDAATEIDIFSLTAPSVGSHLGGAVLHGESTLGGTIGSVALQDGASPQTNAVSCYTYNGDPDGPLTGASAGYCGSQNYYLFPPVIQSGTYYIMYHVKGASTTIATLPEIRAFTTMGTGGMGQAYQSGFCPRLVNCWQDGSNQMWAPTAGASSTLLTGCWTIKLKGPGAGFSFQYNNGTVPTNGAGELWVVGIPNNIYNV